MKTLLPRTEAGPINDHGRETVDKQRASIAEEAAGVRRSLAVLATAAEKAEEDPGSNAEYLATLRKLQSKYEAQLREATKQETSLPSRQ